MNKIEKVFKFKTSKTGRSCPMQQNFFKILVRIWLYNLLPRMQTDFGLIPAIYEKFSQLAVNLSMKIFIFMKNF